MDFCEELRHPQKPALTSPRSIRRGLKVNHSFPLPICLHYCCGMLQLVILILSRERERWQITHPRLHNWDHYTLLKKNLHWRQARFPITHSVLCQCHSFIRQRSHKSSGTRGLLFPSPQGASSVSTTHSSVQDSPRQLF